MQQNYTVFSAPGLRVLAAPWGYALITKFDRMAGGDKKAHDPLDAANYLYEYLRQSGKPNVSVQVIQKLVKRYGLRLRDEDVRAVNQHFRSKFGRLGIVG